MGFDHGRHATAECAEHAEYDIRSERASCRSCSHGIALPFSVYSACATGDSRCCLRLDCVDRPGVAFSGKGGTSVKVGILADSHDHVRNIRRALEIFGERGVETVIHAGDIVAPFAAKALKEFSGPVHAVFGNNDGERAGLAKVLDIAPPPRQFRLAGRIVVLAHEPGEIPDWMQREADAVVTGHTHEAVVPDGNKPLRINPGESGGWLAGRATCVVLDLGSMKAELCEIGEP